MVHGGHSAIATPVAAVAWRHRELLDTIKAAERHLGKSGCEEQESNKDARSAFRRIGMVSPEVDYISAAGMSTLLAYRREYPMGRRDHRDDVIRHGGGRSKPTKEPGAAPVEVLQDPSGRWVFVARLTSRSWRTCCFSRCQIPRLAVLVNAMRPTGKPRNVQVASGRRAMSP